MKAQIDVSDEIRLIAATAFKADEKKERRGVGERGLKGLDLSQVDLVTVDLFDTVLLRDHRCERRRFSVMAKMAHAELAAAGLSVPAAALRQSRMDAQRLAYRAMEAIRPEGEVTLAQIHRLQAIVLALPPAATEILRQTELQYEASVLRPNLRLLRWLSRLHSKGKRIIAISDIYLPGEALKALLDKVAPDHCIGAVYCSAELNLTKRSSKLFTAVLEREHASPNRVLHLGDDRLADLDMPRLAGLQAYWLPRPLMKLARKFDGALLMAGSRAAVAQ